MLVVAKNSIWTKIAQTYVTPDTKMSAREIRQAIEGAQHQTIHG
jgi:hypothetical protein